MDSVRFLNQISGDLMYAGMDNLANEALSRASYRQAERGYEDAMFNLWQNNLQQQFQNFQAGTGPVPDLRGFYNSPYGGGPLTLGPSVPPPTVPPLPPVTPQPVAAEYAAPPPDFEPGEELTDEQKAEFERELAEIKKRQEEAENKLKLLRVHRNRYVDSVRRNGYIVNIPYRFVPDAYYRARDVDVWYPPGLLGLRGVGSVWISREPGAEVYRRMVQDSYEQKLAKPDMSQRIDFANRLFRSYRILIDRCPAEDHNDPDDRDYAIENVRAIGKTVREQFDDYVMHFDNYQVSALRPENDESADTRKRNRAAHDVNMFEISLYRKEEPLNALALLFVIDGSWMTKGHNVGPDLHAHIEKVAPDATGAVRKRIETGLRRRTLTDLGRLLVGLECIATASTVFTFSTERQYQQAYAKAFRGRVRI